MHIHKYAYFLLYLVFPTVKRKHYLEHQNKCFHFIQIHKNDSIIYARAIVTTVAIDKVSITPQLLFIWARNLATLCVLLVEKANNSRAVKL